MSVARAPVVSPYSPPSGPQIVEPRRRKPGHGGLWIGLMLAALLIAGGLYFARRSSLSPSSAPGPVVRTAQVSAAAIERTLRLTGVTAGEDFVSLITPQLRGSRADRLRDASTAAAPASADASVPKAADSAAGASSSTPQNSSAAFRSSTSRFGGPLRGSQSSTASSSASTPAASTAMGSSGLGSAADSLPTGGGNNSDDFDLILQRAVKPGSKVSKGQVVAEFDRQYMLQRLEDYRSSVLQSESALKKQKAELEIVRRTHQQSIDAAQAALEKARLDLKTIPVLSAIDAERTRLALDQAEARYRQLLNEVKLVRVSQDADIRNAELDLAQSRLELKRAEANADKMIVRSPINGLTVMMSMFRGAEFAQIRQGDQLWPGMFFMQIVNSSSMVINAAINQVDVEALRIGMPAHVRFEAYPDLTVQARVESIGAITRAGNQRANWVKEVPVRLRIEQMDPRIIPDLSVSADVVIESERADAAVPTGAVLEDGASGKSSVMVRQALGWQRREVELGIRNHVLAAVRGGLRPGEIVALDPATAGKL
jgi:HlyD family secretion protein